MLNLLSSFNLHVSLTEPSIEYEYFATLFLFISNRKDCSLVIDLFLHPKVLPTGENSAL